MRTCQDCAGTGQATCSVCDGNGNYTTRDGRLIDPCDACHASTSVECEECYGGEAPCHCGADLEPDGQHQQCCVECSTDCAALV